MRRFLNHPTVSYLLLIIIAGAMLGSFEHDWLMDQPRYAALGESMRLSTVTGAVAPCGLSPVVGGGQQIICHDTVGR